MNEIKTIDDIVFALDSIDRDSIRTQSRAGYFAALYKRMTMAVREGIKKSQFKNGPRMETLVIIFAQRYLVAFEAFKKGNECSSSWQGALTGCSNRSLIVLQHLILGINTHINLDLAIAAAAVAPGDGIHALQTDFNRINFVIASLVDDVQRCLEEVWYPMRFLKNMVDKQGGAVLNFSIDMARKTAWANALMLANMNAAGQVPHIKTMDTMVRGIGEKIIRPGFRLQLLLRLVRQTEYEDVSRTIHLIDTTLVQ